MLSNEADEPRLNQEQLHELEVKGVVANIKYFRETGLPFSSLIVPESVSVKEVMNILGPCSQEVASALDRIEKNRAEVAVNTSLQPVAPNVPTATRG